MLQEQVNPEMTAFELRGWLMQNVLLYVNGYAEIEWSGSGEVMALWPLVSARMDFERRNGALRFKYTLPNGDTTAIRASVAAAMQQMNLTARCYHRILKLARTIAALAGAENIAMSYLAETLWYRLKVEAG